MPLIIIDPRYLRPLIVFPEGMRPWRSERERWLIRRWVTAWLEWAGLF